MVDIVMLVAGAGIGAMLRDLFVLHRGDKSKTRQQLESKTPYDYALTNAINERDRLQDELRTIQALKRTEADTERIRNEIDTILPDDGEESTEGAYEADNMRLEIEAAGKRWERNLRELFGDWEIPDVINTSDYGIERLKAERAVYTTLNADDFGEHITIQKHADGTVSPILPKASELDTSPMSAITGMEMEEWADNISKAFAKAYGTNVREDGTKDEQLTDKEEERSLLNGIKEMASENVELAVEFAKMTVQDDEAIRKQLEETSKELAEEIRDVRRRMREFREEEKYYGETLYRKGNR